MEKENTMERPLSEKSFENAKTAIEGGKKDKSLAYPELAEKLVNDFKGKTVQAPIEAILLSSIFLNTKELFAIIKALESDIPSRIADEAMDKVNKGESINSSLMAAVVAAAMKKDW